MNLTTVLDEYYPAVVITSLMRIVINITPTSDKVKLGAVFYAIKYTFKNLGHNCKEYLQIVIPTYLDVLQKPEIRELTSTEIALGHDKSICSLLLNSLGLIIDCAKLHIRPYLNDIFDAIVSFWDCASCPDYIQFELIEIIKSLLLSIATEFRGHISKIIPYVQRILLQDKSRNHDVTARLLSTIQMFGSNVEQHINLVLPPIVRILDLSELSDEIKRLALMTICELGECLMLTDHAPLIIQSLVRLLYHGSSSLHSSIISCLVLMMRQLGTRYRIFAASVDDAVKKKCRTENNEYRQLLLDILEDSSGRSVVIGGSSSSSLEFQYVTTPMPAKVPPPDMTIPTEELNVNHPVWSNMKKFCATYYRSSKEDWLAWLSEMSCGLLTESPATALRACHRTASEYPALARELFYPSFVSCWTFLREEEQNELTTFLQMPLTSAIDNIPEIRQVILNLSEFMEHALEKGCLPIKPDLLCEVAVGCRAYAKALHYKEKQFLRGPVTSKILESLISINNKLQQPDAAYGALSYAINNPQSITINTQWYEELNDWRNALNQYDAHFMERPTDTELLLSKMRCLEALGQWDELHHLVETHWNKVDASDQYRIAPLASNACWSLEKWDDLSKYSDLISSESYDGLVFKAVSFIHTNSFIDAQKMISKARDMIEYDLTSMIGETYGRAYSVMINAQVLTELDEVIKYNLISEKQPRILDTWHKRLKGCQKEVEHWHKILRVRNLVMPRRRDMRTWIKFSSLAQKSGRETLAASVLNSLFGREPEPLLDESIDTSFPAQSSSILSNPSSTILNRSISSQSRGSSRSILSQTLSPRPRRLFFQPLITDDPHLVYAYLKFTWLRNNPDDRHFSYVKLYDYVHALERNHIHIKKEDAYVLLSKCCVRLGKWKRELDAGGALYDDNLQLILNHFQKATEYNKKSYKAWHSWSYMNYDTVVSFSRNRPQRLVSRRHSSLTPTPGPGAAVTFPDGVEGSLAAPSSSLTSLSEEGPARPAVAPTEAFTSTMPSQVPLPSSDHSSPALIIGPPVGGAPSSAAAAVTPPPSVEERPLAKFCQAAVHGLIQSILLASTAEGSLQDTLRLLAIWFDYGQQEGVYEALATNINEIPVMEWLQVIPQLIARIDMIESKKAPLIGRLLQEVLTEVGRVHPQALIYPLTVAAQDECGTEERSRAAHKILASMKEHCPSLVDQANMVSKELIRVAILLHEEWHEAIEDASKAWFANGSFPLMMTKLRLAHRKIEEQPETQMESSFIQNYGQDLADALNWCNRYRDSNNTTAMNEAWDRYYHVFRRITKQLPQLTTLDLQIVSPKLLRCRDLELAVPGTYNPLQSPIGLHYVRSPLHVITSKQRPRRLSIYGNDGEEYQFLLKGHEDLRQDERVMQLFGLINSLLLSNPDTARCNLAIERFAVIPLSTNNGLIGWVPETDTLHALIKDYREPRHIALNLEHKIMLKAANCVPQDSYERLTLIQKVQAFEHGINSSDGDHLAKILLHKSASSEVWFERRSNYTRSLAVMSIVGYILGLGDRHPSNLMLHRQSGKVIHIDFGDCFEVAISRERFPEKIPFRLTRMMVKAMEVTGINGNYRRTCERVMKVLRDNKDSLLAVLEAFVYDPLLNWRLLADEGDKTGGGDGPNTGTAANSSSTNPSAVGAVGAAGAAGEPNQDDPSLVRAPKVSSSRRSGAKRSGGGGGGGIVGGSDTSLFGPEENEKLKNQRALTILKRINDKLTGRDFDNYYTTSGADSPSTSSVGNGVSTGTSGRPPPIGEKEQVENLINIATDVVNLCQCYTGWCPFW